MIVDPLANMQVEVTSYDIRRVASVYFDTSGERCWTKAWFNDREKGEPAVEITRKLAIAFITGTIGKDEWLSRFFPKQMTACRSGVEMAREKMMNFG